MAECAVAVIAPNDNGVTGVVRFSMEAKTMAAIRLALISILMEQNTVV